MSFASPSLQRLERVPAPAKLNLVGRVTAFYRRLDGVATPVSGTTH